MSVILTLTILAAVEAVVIATLVLGLIDERNTSKTARKNEVKYKICLLSIFKHTKEFRTKVVINSTLKLKKVKFKKKVP